MDLKQIDQTEDAQAFEFEVINPKDQQTLMSLTLAGPTHPARLALKRKYERKLSGNIKRSNDVRRALSNTMTEALDDDDLKLERQIEELMASTLDWSGLESAGQSAPYDKAMMERWYRAKLWLRELVSTELNRSENFIGSSQPRP